MVLIKFVIKVKKKMIIFVAQECKKAWANLRDAYKELSKKCYSVRSKN